ncbi:MAG: class I tRNA ligase family protein, partial [Rickettsiaceae bacterium]|nr:class I tRNA ligase family protein [Rickettsiaceae bacterium]
LKAHLHENTLPWKNIMISGWCLAEDRSKMSKSKGNVITPEKLLEEYGADVIRYWASNARLGADTTFSQDVINNGKRLINKLWNSAKFVELHIANLSEDNIDIHELLKQNIICCSSDKAIIVKLSNVRDKVNDYLEQYEYSLAREAIEQFFWQDFCDNYIEIVKARIYNEDKINMDWQISAQRTIKFCFEVILKLFAPFLPYITEELYQNLFDAKKSIHSRHNWPGFAINNTNKEDLLHYSYVLKILDEVRKAKSARNLSMKSTINSLVINHDENWSIDIIYDLTKVANAKSVEFKNDGAWDKENLVSIDF